MDGLRMFAPTFTLLQKPPSRRVKMPSKRIHLDEVRQFLDLSAEESSGEEESGLDDSLDDGL